MVLRIKCFSIPMLKSVQHVCNTEVVGKVRHFTQYSLFPESQQKCHWLLFLPKESRPKNGWVEVKMKRIFLYFPVARETQVERPVTPVMCCLAHERQKGGHHVHKHSQVPRAPVSDTSYPLHRDRMEFASQWKKRILWNISSTFTDSKIKYFPYSM